MVSPDSADPFLGSGTTALAAKNLGRNSIGYEINEDFLPVIKEKLGLKQGSLFQDSSFEILTQKELRTDFKEEINKLPYIFRDPIKFDKKIDPKKMCFGSKIDKSHLRAARRWRGKPGFLSGASQALDMVESE